MIKLRDRSPQQAAQFPSLEILEIQWTGPSAICFNWTCFKNNQVQCKVKFKLIQVFVFFSLCWFKSIWYNNWVIGPFFFFFLPNPCSYLCIHLSTNRFSWCVVLPAIQRCLSQYFYLTILRFPGISLRCYFMNPCLNSNRYLTMMHWKNILQILGTRSYFLHRINKKNYPNIVLHTNKPIKIKAAYKRNEQCSV